MTIRRLFIPPKPQTLLRLSPRQITSQPNPPRGINLSLGIDTAITPVGGTKGQFLTVTGQPFALTGGAYVDTVLNKAGLAVTQTGSNYFSRARPWPLAKGRTWSAVIVCGASATQGIWSVAASEIVSTPHLLLQRNGTDIRLYAPGTGYVATFTGVATAGALLHLSWGYTELAASTAGTAYLAVNGQLKSGAYAGGTNAATNEYLFSGYSAQFVGDINHFASLPGCSAALITALSVNPWHVFKARARKTWLPTTAAAGASTGSVSATQAGDSLTGSGQLALAATLSATQAGNTLTGQGALAISATLTQTQAADTLSSTGTLGASGITGTLSATQASNSITAQGALAIGATLSATQASNTVTAHGELAIGATLSATQASNTITAQAALALSGSLTATQAGDTLTASGTGAHSGDLSATQANNTLTGSGALSLSGYLTATQAGDTLSASAVLAIVGSMSATQAADTLAATGARDLFATLSAVQAGQTLTASGTSVAGLTDSQKIDLILKILSDKQTLDAGTGLYTLYDTDGTTVLYTAAAWEDVAATQPYRGQGLARLDAMQ